MIFNSRGLPWTVGLSLAWTIGLALFSCGLCWFALGLYLAFWVRIMNGRSVALWCYLIAAFALSSSISGGFRTSYNDALAIIGCGLLLIASLVLRKEIVSLYRDRHGVHLEVNVLLTILFSSVYLNHCLLDIPFVPLSKPSSGCVEVSL